MANRAAADGASAENDHEDTGTGPDQLGEREEIAAEPQRRARARRPAPIADVSPFGAFPQGVARWGMQRATLGGTWEPCSHPDGTGARRHEWPIADLSVETVKERWGNGTFRVQWFRPGDNGGRKFMSVSPPVTIEAPATADAPPAAAPAPSSPIAAMGEMLQVLDVIDSKADAKIRGLAEMAKIFGKQRDGEALTGRDLLDALRDEREANAAATKAAIAEAVAPLQQKIDALTAGGGGGGLAAGAASAAASAFGEGTLGTVMRFAADQPELAQTIVEKGAPVIQSALTTLLGLFSSAKAAAPPAAVEAPRARPRAMPAAAPTPAPGPVAPVVVVDGSLSAWETRTPTAPSPPANGATAAAGPVHRAVVVESEAGPSPGS